VIARLVGRCVSHDGARAVIDVRDVGYAVVAARRDLDAWSASPDPVTVHVITDVREDAITLYGFSDDLDRVTFEKLREVEGIGPKVALSTLDTLSREQLHGAVEKDEIAVLCRVPGVGKKLALRMALELKGKLPVGAFVAPTGPTKAPEADPLDLALARLGYSRSEIVRAAEGLAAEGLSGEPVAERLRHALRILSSR